MKQFIKKCAEKLSDFKFLARIMMVLGACAAVFAILGFVAFQYSGGETANGARIAAFGAQKQEREIIGMVFFFVLAAYLVLGIVVLYQSYQYAFPKTKLSPNKTLPILVIVDGVLAVVAAIFAILAIVVDNSVIPAWWGVLAGVFFVDGFVNACMLVPVLKSHYFMPKLEADK